MKQYIKGFTLIELLLTMAIFLILLGLTTINFTSVQRETTVNSTIDTLLADISQQQIKAMVGDTEGSTMLSDYGIHFESGSYTLFRGTYSASNPENFIITVPDVQEITTTLPSNEVIFQKGTGDFLNYLSSQNSITITDPVKGAQRVIEFNRYGVVTRVN